MHQLETICYQKSPLKLKDRIKIPERIRIKRAEIIKHFSNRTLKKTNGSDHFAKVIVSIEGPT